MYLTEETEAEWLRLSSPFGWVRLVPVRYPSVRGFVLERTGPWAEGQTQS